MGHKYSLEEEQNTPISSFVFKVTQIIAGKRSDYFITLF